MSLHSAPLDLDNMAESDDTSLAVNFEVFSYWYDNGYPIDEIHEAYAVVNEKVDDENSSHIVLRVQTLSKPLDKADAVEDQHNIYVCDCRDYRYNKSVDLTDKWLSEWGSCKHCREVSMSEKAKQDEQQRTL